MSSLSYETWTTVDQLNFHDYNSVIFLNNTIVLFDRTIICIGCFSPDVLELMPRKEQFSGIFA